MKSEGIHMNLLEKYIDVEHKYYIYGTGSFGMYCYKAIVETLGEDSVEAFVESFPSASEWRGKPIISPDQILYQQENVRIIVASVTNSEEMRNRLLELKIPNWKIMILDELMPYFRTLRSGNEVIESICLWPPVTAEKGFLAKKISWFAPGRITVVAFGDITDFSCNIVEGQVENKKDIFEKVDKIYVWQADAVDEDVKAFVNKVHIIDPNFFLYTESLNYDKLFYRSLDYEQRMAMVQRSKEIFIQMHEVSKLYRRANIFCSGPSIQEAYERKYDGCFNIVCKSIVKDQQLMHLLNPKVIVFTDINYYLSPTAYCSQFLQDLKKTQKEYDSFVIVREYEVALLLYHCPELKGRVIGMDIKSINYSFPNEKELQVKPTSNIMTELMLSVASALSDEIGIFGCTGRCPDENFYWQHNPNTQYHDLMQSIFDMYPSVFRDQGYADYYDRHCNIVKEIIEYGQSMGKKYVNCTTSFIPALIQISSEVADEK